MSQLYRRWRSSDQAQRWCMGIGVGLRTPREPFRVALPPRSGGDALICRDRALRNVTDEGCGPAPVVPMSGRAEDHGGWASELLGPGPDAPVDELHPFPDGSGGYVDQLKAVTAVRLLVETLERHRLREADPAHRRRRDEPE